MIETCLAEGAFPSSEKLTSLVRQHFPTSRWSETHYAWYKHQIKRGKIFVTGISEESPGEFDSDLGGAEVDEVKEASISLERDLHSYYSTRVGDLEPGLNLVANGVEYQTDAGRIDLLARDVNSHLVVIELKAGEAKDNALGQLLGYVGCLSASESSVRGILVASSFDSRVVFAVKALPAIRLLQYQVSFNLQPIT